MIGQTFGQYRVLEEIGKGGMGIVYRAHDSRLDRDVAIKILQADSIGEAGAQQRLLREAQLASALNDPHICTIYEVGEAGGRAFIVMELVEGRPLKALIPPEGLPPGLVVRYGTQIAAALAHAHDHKIIHRDVKTSNIVITPSGQVKVLDFGLARRPKNDEIAEATRSLDSVTKPGMVVGTLPYLAPEILRGTEADARSDVWALGIVLYEMSAGQLPFRGQTGYEFSSAILRESPAPLPPRIPAGIRIVIQGCLEKEPGHRYQRAGEARAALEAAQPDASTSSPFSTSAIRTALPVLTSRRLRHHIVWAAGSLMAVLVGVLIALNINNLRRHLSVPGPSAGRIQSLAVLPLENFSRDPEQEYFVDGMTEELTMELSQIRALRVTSRTSTMRYKGTRKSVPEIAKELNVDAIVEGSVERSGDRVRISAQLIQALTDTHLWAKSYERDLRDILPLQSEVARAISQQIQAEITPAGRTMLTAARQVDPAAYELYLRGLYFWNKGTEEGALESRKYYEQALDKDPTFSPAYVGVAFSFNLLNDFANAKEAAKKAIALDDVSGEAHAALAFATLNGDWDWAAAGREFQKALELAPNSAIVRHAYALYLYGLARNKEAIEEMQHAIELDPRSPLANANLGEIYFAGGHLDQAMQQARTTLEVDPNYLNAEDLLGRVYLRKGMYDEATMEFQKALVKAPTEDRQATMAFLYAAQGRKAEAKSLLGQVIGSKKMRPSSVDSYYVARIYLALGEKDKAFEWLQKAYKERSSEILGIKADPFLETLHTDPRYADLLRRMGLPM